MGAIVHWRLVAEGVVQGVGYRARVAACADRHRVVGSVANRRDGTVLLDVQGPVEDVEAFVRDVRGPHGMSDARVVRRVTELPVVPGVDGFVVR